MTSRLVEEFIKDEVHDECVKVAKRIIAANALPLDDIAEITDLPLDEVKQLAEQNRSDPAPAQKK